MTPCVAQLTEDNQNGVVRLLGFLNHNMDDKTTHPVTFLSLSPCNLVLVPCNHVHVMCPSMLVQIEKYLTSCHEKYLTLIEKMTSCVYHFLEATCHVEHHGDAGASFCLKCFLHCLALRFLLKK